MGLRTWVGLKKPKPPLQDSPNLPQKTQAEFRTDVWTSVAQRANAGAVLPEFSPSFSLSPADTIFTIGSCFARNIEEHLRRRGCNVPSLEFAVPRTEWVGQRPSGILNKYASPELPQEIVWAERIFARGGIVHETDCEPSAFSVPDGTVVDLQLGGHLPVTRPRFLERRQQLYELYASAFRAHCVVVTPGLIEAWRDTETGLYVIGPPARLNRTAKDRFLHEMVGYERCVADLLTMIDTVRRHNPTCKFIVTTSPVPLHRTFSNLDIATANTLAKSTLRAACGAVAQMRPFVDYFPSYEAVMLSGRAAWSPDLRHVQDAFVGVVVNHMLRGYVRQSGH